MSDGPPDFVVIGAMKAASTTLYGYLSEHPGVGLPELKELDFFVAEKTWTMGWDWYREQFAAAPAGALLGDISPNYTKAPGFGGVPERLRAHAPDAKLVYLLRDPVERTRSHYTHSRLSLRERRSAEEAIVAGSTYVDVSRYGFQLSRYLEHFPREQILVLLTEDLRDDPARVLARIEDFLGLAHHAYADLNRRDYDSSARRANLALAHRIRRNDRLIWWLRRTVPAPVRTGVARRLTRKVDTSTITVSDDVFMRLRGLLAADWAVLHEQTGLELARWPQLRRLLATADGADPADRTP